MEKFNQYLLATAGLVIFIGFSIVVSVNVADAEQLTGCLTNKGKLQEFALGDAPLKRCKSRQMEISIPQVPQLVITSVFIDSDQDTITINGQNFMGDDAAHFHLQECPAKERVAFRGEGRRLALICEAVMG